MGLAIAVNFINRSNDSGNSEVVIFEARPSVPPLHTLRFHNNTGSTQTFVCFQRRWGPAQLLRRPGSQCRLPTESR